MIGFFAEPGGGRLKCEEEVECCIVVNGTEKLEFNYCALFNSNLAYILFTTWNFALRLDLRHRTLALKEFTSNSGILSIF